MQRLEAKIGLRDRKGRRRPREWNDTGENPHRNGLSRVGAGICGFVGLDGGHDRDRTCDPYHVKVRALAIKSLFHRVFFPLLLSIAQSLPNYLSFFICS